MTRVTQPMLDVFGYLVTKGLHEKGAAVIVGNGAQESGENLDPTMYRAHPDASGGVRQDLNSGGFLEWLGDRKLKYLDFSKAAEAAAGLPAGALLNDRFTQCDFTIHELTTEDRYDSLYAQLTTETGRTIANLTANFMEIFERPSNALNAQGKRIDGLDNRIEHAEAVYDRVQLIKAAQAGQPGPAVPVEPPALPRPQIPVPPVPTVPAGPLPISASDAGFYAALQDKLAELHKQRDAIDSKISLVEKTASEFAFDALPKPLALPKPSAIPAAVVPQQRSTTVFGANWQTTFSGIVAALMGVAQFIPALQPYVGVINAIGLVAAGGVGVTAKGKNVTGGTISAVDGSTVARPVSIIPPAR